MPGSNSKPTVNPVSRTRLKNGSVLLVKEDPSTPVVSLNIWIEAGSIDEQPDERGMAHLIEHMIFKGTSQRGVGEISRQVEAAGGYLNAFTSFEHTCFYVVLPSNQIQKALEVEFDAYLHSTFDAGELAKEKEVVFEEMRMRRDDPWSWSWELLFKILFKKNPYHWPVIGDMKILKQVPRESLMDYYKAHYVPSNTVISVVGNVSAKRVRGWVGKHFESVQRPKPPQRRFKFDENSQELKVHAEAGDVQKTYLSLGFPTVPLNHPDSAALEILAAVLGEGAASRFNLALREKSQSADDAACEYFSGKFGGAVVFQALTDGVRIEKCLGEMMAELGKIKAKGVPETELAKVKTKVKASKVFENQSVDGQAKTLGFWELQGGYELEEAFLKALDAVSSDDLRRVAAAYFAPKQASLVVYHPKAQTMRLNPSHLMGLLLKGLDSAVGPQLNSHHKGGPITKLRLKNGDILWAKERKNLPLVSLGAFVKGGFPLEVPGKYGMTTLMSKCLQKGTLRKNHEKFSKEIEGYAAHLDSVMEKDYWGMSLDVLQGNFEKSLDLMVEALYEPAFSALEVQKEKKLQISALERLKDDPAEFALLQSDILTFAGTPYAHMPLGTIPSLSALSAEDIRIWHRSHLSKSPLTWFAVGDFDANEIKHLLESRLPASGKGNRSKSFAAPPPLVPKVLEFGNESQQANLVLGFRAPSFVSPDYFPFRVLNTLLNGMGGKLFIELREKKSLAYSVFASHEALAFGGTYQVYIGCAPDKAGKAKEELRRVLQSVALGKITAEELERAKTYMTGLYHVGFQSNHAQVHSYARYEMTGVGAPVVEEFPERIRKVTLEQVKKTAKKYLDGAPETWVLLAPKTTPGAK